MVAISFKTLVKHYLSHFDLHRFGLLNLDIRNTGLRTRRFTCIIGKLNLTPRNLSYLDSLLPLFKHINLVLFKHHFLYFIISLNGRFEVEGGTVHLVFEICHFLLHVAALGFVQHLRIVN